MSSQHFTNYLNDISKVPLLTHQEEIKLGTTIQTRKGSTERSDKRAVKRAMVKLVGANLRLVVKAANYYRNSHQDIEELCFEGNRGLLTAAERFDPNKGCRFSTYATWWIQQNIRLAVNASHTVRTPIRRASQIAKIQSAPSFDPDLEEQDTAKLSKETNIAEEDVKKLLKYRTQLLTMDAPISDSDGTTTLQSALPSEEPPADEQLIQAELLQKLREALKKLPPEKRKVVKLRFGLDNRPAQTLEEIAVVIGKTRERIRKIQIEGIRMLQHEIQKLGYPISPSALLKMEKPSVKKVNAIDKEATNESPKQTEAIQESAPSTASKSTQEPMPAPRKINPGVRARISTKLKAYWARIRAAKAEATAEAKDPSPVGANVAVKEPLPVSVSPVSAEVAAKEPSPTSESTQENPPALTSKSKMSPEARARISVKLKAHWARIHAAKAEAVAKEPSFASAEAVAKEASPASESTQENPPAPAKSKMSPEARARISAKLKAHWARIHAAKAEAAAKEPSPVNAEAAAKETSPASAEVAATEPSPTSESIQETLPAPTSKRKKSPEVRARISATLKAQWVRIRTALAAAAAKEPPPASESTQETPPAPATMAPSESATVPQAFASVLPKVNQELPAPMPMPPETKPAYLYAA